MFSFAGYWHQILVSTYIPSRNLCWGKLSCVFLVLCLVIDRHCVEKAEVCFDFVVWLLHRKCHVQSRNSIALSTIGRLFSTVFPVIIIGAWMVQCIYGILGQTITDDHSASPAEDNKKIRQIVGLRPPMCWTKFPAGKHNANPLEYFGAFATTMGTMW